MLLAIMASKAYELQGQSREKNVIFVVAIVKVGILVYVQSRKPKQECITSVGFRVQLLQNQMLIFKQCVLAPVKWQHVDCNLDR